MECPNSLRCVSRYTLRTMWCSIILLSSIMFYYQGCCVLIMSYWNLVYVVTVQLYIFILVILKIILVCSQFPLCVLLCPASRSAILWVIMEMLSPFPLCVNHRNSQYTRSWQRTTQQHTEKCEHTRIISKIKKKTYT